MATKVKAKKKAVVRGETASATAPRNDKGETRVEAGNGSVNGAVGRLTKGQGHSDESGVQDFLPTVAPVGAAVELLDPKGLKPSPFNRRKAAGEAYIAELAESIRVNGQLEPIVVRQLPLEAAVPGGVNELEIIFGHCRSAACERAGVQVKAIVRTGVTDVQAAIECAAENFNRRDLTPMEEAETFAQLMTVERAPGVLMTQRDVAKLLGVEEKQVSRRMQLVQLADVWKRAARDAASAVSGWPVGHWEYLARFPKVTQDRIAESLHITKAGKYQATIGGGAHYETVDMRGWSLEDLRETVTDDFRLVKTAPWHVDDEYLNPEAGSCTACKKRSDVDPGLFDPGEFDPSPLGKKATDDAACLDGACWEKKRKAFVKRQEKTYKVEYPELVTVGEKNAYKWEVCKKGKPGAVPVLWTEGAKSGKLEWCANRYESDSRGEDPDAEKGKKEDPVKKKRAEVDVRRGCVLVEVFDKALQALCAGLLKGSAHWPKGWELEDALAFARVVGVVGPEVEPQKISKAFATDRKALVRTLAERLLGEAIYIFREHAPGRFQFEHQKENVSAWFELAAELTGLDFAAERAKVNEAIPYAADGKGDEK